MGDKKILVFGLMGLMLMLPFVTGQVNLQQADANNWSVVIPQPTIIITSGTDDTNATTGCTGGEVLLGNGTCMPTSQIGGGGGDFSFTDFQGSYDINLTNIFNQQLNTSSNVNFMNVTVEGFLNGTILAQNRFVTGGGFMDNASIVLLEDDFSGTDLAIGFETDGVVRDMIRYRPNDDRISYGGNTAVIDDMRFGVGPGGDMRFNIGGVSSMFLDALGNIGIGTDSPSHTLNVNGTLNVSTSLGSGLYVNGSGFVGVGTATPLAQLHSYISGSTYTPNAGTAFILQNSENDGDAVQLELISGEDGTSAIVFGAESDALINRLICNPDQDGSPSPVCRFLIDKTEILRMTSGRIAVGGDSSPDFTMEVFSTEGDGYFGITQTDDGDIFTVDSSGKVGINTASPASKLEIAGTTAYDPTNAQTLGDELFMESIPGGPVQDEFGGAISFSGPGRAGAKGASIVAFGDSDSDSDLVGLSFFTKGTTGTAGALTERIRIDSLGNVGIGTTTPASPLNVVGKVNFSHSGSGNNLIIEETGIANGDILFIDDGGATSQISFDRTTHNLRISSDGAVQLSDGVKMGIGTNAPITLLQVGDGADSKNINLSIATGGNNNASLDFIRQEIVDAQIMMDNDEDLRIRNLFSDGDMRFEVNDGGVITEIVSIQGSTSTVGINDSTPDLMLEIVGTTTDGAFGITNGATGIRGDYFIIDEVGNMGIHVSNPFAAVEARINNNEKFLIRSGSGSNSTLQIGEAGTSRTQGGILRNNGATNVFTIGTEVTGENSTSIYLPYGSNQGHVGIGTAFPDANLTVVGSINMSSSNTLSTFTMGHQNFVTGDYGAFAIGRNNVVNGRSGFASGRDNNVTNTDGFAIGQNIINTGVNAFSGGQGAATYADRAFSFGNAAYVEGVDSFSLGREINVSGFNSFGISLNNPGSHYLITANNVMAIMGGSVGIGTSAPSESLEVTGNITLDGTLLNGYQVYDGYQNFIGETFTSVPQVIKMNVENFDDPFFEHNTGAGDSSNVTVKVTGRYRIDWNVNIDVNSGTSRTTAVCQLYQNGVPVAGTNSTSYHRQSAGGDQANVKSMYQCIDEGDLIMLACVRNTGGASTLQFMADSSMSLEFKGASTC